MAKEAVVDNGVMRFTYRETPAEAERRGAIACLQRVIARDNSVLLREAIRALALLVLTEEQAADGS